MRTIVIFLITMFVLSIQTQAASLRSTQQQMDNQTQSQMDSTQMNLTMNLTTAQQQALSDLNQLIQDYGGDVEQFFNDLFNININDQHYEISAENFDNQTQFNDFIQNVTKLANQIGQPLINSTDLNALIKLMQQSFDQQIQEIYYETQLLVNETMQQLFANQPIPQFFQDYQNQIQQLYQNADYNGMSDAKDKIQQIQDQSQQMENNRHQAEQQLESLSHNLEQLAQSGNSQQILQQLQQFQSLQIPGKQFSQLCQNLSQINVFNTTQSADQASQMLSTLSQISQTQGNVDILAQTSTADSVGVQSAQQCMDDTREEGQKKFSEFIGNGQSQYIASSGMFFQGFNPDNQSSDMTIGQNGQVQMNLPSGLMKKFNGYSNVVAQISLQNQGEWDSIPEIANLGRGKIVDIKFFAGNNTQNISGLSGTEQFNFCIPLINTSTTDCLNVKCSYIDPKTLTLKYDGVSTSSAVKYVPGTNTRCCECTASHATSFTLVASKSSEKLMIMSLFGFLVAIFTFFLA